MDTTYLVDGFFSNEPRLVAVKVPLFAEVILWYDDVVGCMILLAVPVPAIACHYATLIVRFVLALDFLEHLGRRVVYAKIVVLRGEPDICCFSDL